MFKCKKCDGALTMRVGENGVFYGCNNYPKCKYTKSTDNPYLKTIKKEPIENRCNKCYSKDVVRMVWGNPTQQAIEAQERGEIALGGCLHGGYNYFCNNCDNGF